MNFGEIESFLIQRLRRRLGRQVQVIQGPYYAPALGGLKPMIFLHAGSFLDFEGIAENGACIAPRPVKDKGPYKGFEEERPGRITITITVISASYPIVQKLGQLVSPYTLLFLMDLKEVALGLTPGNRVRLFFRDIKSELHAVNYSKVVDDKGGFFCGTITFYLNGFLHLRLTKRSVKATKVKKVIKKIPQVKSKARKPVRRMRSKSLGTKKRKSR